MVEAAGKLQELSGPVVSQAYKLTWEQEYLDLTELARLRCFEKWKIKLIAEHLQISAGVVEERLRTIKIDPSRIHIKMLRRIRRLK